MSLRNTTRYAVTLTAILVILMAVSGCGKKSETAAARGQDVQGTTGQASLQEVPRVVTATGSLEAGRTVMVSTRMMGWVRKVHVREGQTVAKGDLLVSIDDSDLRAKKAQAEAGIIEAKAVLANTQKMAERFEKLYAEKSVSKQQLDDVLTGRDRAAAGLQMAEAGLTEVKVHLSYLSVTAPTEGVVARKMIEEGDMANPGMPLVSLESTGAMKVVAHLGEKDVSSVKVGDPVTIDITSLDGAVFTAPLDKVIPAANPGSRTYDIEVLLPDPDPRLKSGMFARVSVPVGTRQAVLVPTGAVIRRGQLTGIWIVREDGTAHLRWVRLGRAIGDSLEILSGLTGSETVVLSTQQPLAEGDRVVK
ncbi:MAG: efflux RND transporter periplasmic adaptor subunit [Candidatus Krumholzibacteriota bacterium]